MLAALLHLRICGHMCYAAMPKYCHVAMLAWHVETAHMSSGKDITCSKLVMWPLAINRQILAQLLMIFLGLIISKTFKGCSSSKTCACKCVCLIV